MYKLLLKGFAGVLLAVAVSAPAFAALITNTGSTTIVAAPTDTSSGAVENDGTILVFQELDEFVLASDLDVNILGSGSASGSGNPGVAGAIAAGTAVDIWFVHLDPTGNNTAALTGVLGFDRPILGVIGQTGLMNTADMLFGPTTGITYPTGTNFRGTFDSAFDRIVTAGSSIDFDLLAGNGFIDQFRIIVASDTVVTVPEPSSLAVLGFGLGLVGLGRRKSLKRG